VYARRAFQSSFLMKQLDPSIETVAAGSSGRNMSTYLAWDREVLETGWDTIDYISAHRYSSNAAQDTPQYLADGVEIDRILSDYASVIGYVRGLRRSNKHVYLAFDEWNVWYRARQGEHTRGGWREAPPLLEEHYNLEDAVVVAQYLAAFLRRADLVKVACLAQIVNAIAPVLTRPEGILLQTIFHPFALFAQHANGQSLTPRIESPAYAAGAHGAVPVLDAASTFDQESGTLAAFLINRSQGSLSVEVRLEDRRLAAAPQAVVFGGGSVAQENTWEHPDRVRPGVGRVERNDSGCRVEVPGPGLAVVTLATSSR
jgi:alpha-N-arabinofuranosidase